VIAVGLLAVFIHRCRVVPNPLLELSLFRVRNFRWANAAAFVFAIGFNAMFLGNILFFTMVWQFSILEAGLAIGLGPLIVALTAPWFGKLAGHIGQRALLIPGGLVFATGGAMLLARMGTTPSYVTEFLPALLFTAVGVALCLPQLSSAAVQGLPPDRYGAGSATTQAVRNLGATIGVAIVIAFVAGATGGQLEDFRRVWWLLVVCGVTISVLSTQLTPGAPASAHPDPVPAAA
jgi:MFS family permease